ncbi:hypothetical protein GQ44DRAFT_767512 [Phaeosphaeriaceae sp. PMI808]|nr:hypothetical protein GQ44DRAFT_767512 [Phaeosphaeriaceae sp. PMI808]
MADPLSIIASVVTIAGLAYSSSKALYELILTIRDAPSEFQGLNQEINTLSHILDSLKTSLPKRAATLGESQLTCLTAIEQTLQGCDLACKAFKDKVNGLTVHSQDGKRSFRDGVKLKFQSKSIKDFHMKVVSWKASLALALDVALLTSTHPDRDTFHTLEKKMATAKDQITVGLEMVNSRLDKLLTLESESEEELQMVAQKRAVEEQQKAALMQCLSLSQAAANGATRMTGHSFRNNKVLAEAKAIYGDVGQAQSDSNKHSYESNEASGGELQSHNDIPEGIRQQLYAEEQQRLERQQKSPRRSTQETPPITITNVLPGPTYTPPNQQAETYSVPRLNIPGLWDLAVKDYTEWQLLQVRSESLKADIRTVRDIAPAEGLDLQQIYEDQDAAFFVEKGVRRGITWRFVRDIEYWVKDIKLAEAVI